MDAMVPGEELLDRDKAVIVQVYCGQYCVHVLRFGTKLGQQGRPVCREIGPGNNDN
jgi:hypothetical protein